MFAWRLKFRDKCFLNKTVKSMRSKHFSPAWNWPSLKIPMITARNSVTVNNHNDEVKTAARCRRWCESLWSGRNVFCSVVTPDGALCVPWPPSALKLFLCAGPGPSDTGSTTEKPWEASSPRSETSTWSIISGVRYKMTKCAAVRMIMWGRL